MTMIASLLLAAVQPAAANAPFPAEVFTFTDWAVACDNGNRCEAVSLVPEHPDADADTPAPAAGQPAAGQAQAAPAEDDPWARFGVLKFERGPEADAPLMITISDFEGTPARLLQYSTPVEARITRVEEGVWRVEPANLRAFVDALYSGSLEVQDANGRKLSELALNGAWGALLYMDERQGRLGTPTAALRRGRRPLSIIPAPPALPVVVAAPRTTERPLVIPAARIAEVRRQYECRTEDVGGEASQDTAALGNGRTLIMLSCGAGAYNFSSMPLIAWRDGGAIRIEPARVDVERDYDPDADQGGEADKFLVTNADFDAATMSINEYAKGRGLGDCGVSASYVWDGTMFRLTEQSEMSECRGTMEFLTTWRANVQRR